MIRLRWYALGLLCVILGMGGESGRAERVKLPKLPDDLRLVTSECTSLTTIRVAEVFRKFGIEKMKKFAPLNQFEPMFGFAFTDMERWTSICFANDESILVIQGNKPWDRKRMLAIMDSLSNEEKIAGISIWSNLADQKSVAFLTDTVLLYGNKLAVKRCLERASEQDQRSNSLSTALCAALEHDCVSWEAKDRAVLWKKQETPLALESLTTIDLGKDIRITTEWESTDVDQSQRLLKNVKGSLKMIQGTLMAACGALEASDVVNPGEEFEAPISAEFVRLMEQGLQQTKIHHDAPRVKLEIAIPITAERLWVETESVCSCLCRVLAEGTDSTGHKSLDTQLRLTLGNILSAKEDAPPAATLSPYVPPGLDKPEIPIPALVPVYSPAEVLPPAPVSLTIVNIRKQEAVLFVQGTDGKMTFKQKLPPGKAVDVEAPQGVRWVAVFGSTTAETFEPKLETVWLLRPTPKLLAPVRVPQTPAPSPLSDLPKE